VILLCLRRWPVGGPAINPTVETAAEHFEPGLGNVEVMPTLERSGVSRAVGDGADEFRTTGVILSE